MDSHEKRSYLVESIVTAVVNVVKQVVPENQRRLALFMFAPSGAVFSTQPHLLSSGEGGSFPSALTVNNIGQAWLSRKLHGAAVTSAWYALNSVSGDQIQVIEVLEE